MTYATKELIVKLSKPVRSLRRGFAGLIVCGTLVFVACSSQPSKIDPGTTPVRNQACMTECRERKCEAYTGCYERCEEKGMGPAIAGCRSQCDIKFRYCNDACTAECDARYPG